MDSASTCQRHLDKARRSMCMAPENSKKQRRPWKTASLKLRPFQSLMENSENPGIANPATYATKDRIAPLLATPSVPRSLSTLKEKAAHKAVRPAHKARVSKAVNEVWTVSV